MLLIVLLGCALTGALMKLTDDIEDEDLCIPVNTASITGIAYGILLGALMILDQNAAHLFAGIILGCLITGKIDARSHSLALAAILLILFTQGISLHTSTLIIITALAALDEVTSGLSGTPMPLQRILRYRIALKIGVIVFAAAHILHWSAAAYLLSFDAAYILTGHITDKNNKAMKQTI